MIYCTEILKDSCQPLCKVKRDLAAVTDAISNNVKVFPHNNLAEWKQKCRFLFLPVTCPFALLLKTTLLSSFLERDPTDHIFAVGTSWS